MTRNGKWKTFAPDSATLSDRNGTNWESPRKHSLIYADWTALISAELNAAKGMWHWSISKRLREP